MSDEPERTKERKNRTSASEEKESRRRENSNIMVTLFNSVRIG